MFIICKILSDDYLTYQKIHFYIKETPYFILEEKYGVPGNEQMLFWDIDTIEIDQAFICKMIGAGCFVFFISSIIPRDILYGKFEEQISNSMGFLRKKMTYSHFIEEVSNVFDKNFKDKKVL